MITNHMRNKNLMTIKVSIVVYCCLFFSCGNESIENNVIERFSNGDVKYFSSQLNSLRNGPEAIFGENWQLLELCYFENDTLYGNYYKWDGNRCLKSITRYINGKEDGLELIFYQNGKLESVTSYSHGSKNGPQRFFHYNGEGARLVFWKNGVLNGDDIYWYNNGVVKQKSYWINGRTNGKYLQYFTDGSIEIQGEFHLGKKINKWVYFSSNESEPYIENYSKK